MQNRLSVKKRVSNTFRWLVVLLSVGTIGGVQAETPDVFSELFAFQIPLKMTTTGNFAVNASLDGVEDEFLLDTGASMVTVTEALFKKIRSKGAAVKTRRIGARLASGKLEVLNVYQIDNFSLGADCALGPIEIAVMKRGGRNLVGMNALSQASPFAISTTPPILGLTGCML